MPIVAVSSTCRMYNGVNITIFSVTAITKNYFTLKMMRLRSSSTVKAEVDSLDSTEIVPRDVDLSLSEKREVDSLNSSETGVVDSQESTEMEVREVGLNSSGKGEADSLGTTEMTLEGCLIPTVKEVINCLVSTVREVVNCLVSTEMTVREVESFLVSTVTEVGDCLVTQETIMDRPASRVEVKT